MRANGQEILAFDPFEGDFGSPDDRVFANKMVTARKLGPCSNCGAEIQPTERVRRQTSKFDGELMTHRWCHLCCDAMANYQSQLSDENRDDLPDYELRARMHRKNVRGGAQ